MLSGTYGVYSLMANDACQHQSKTKKYPHIDGFIKQGDAKHSRAK